VRVFRGLCLGCFCILGVAFVVAIVEAAAFERVVAISLCRMNAEILPNFTCGEGVVRQSLAMVLNLPFMFIYAVGFTLFWEAPPSRTFMLLLYGFDVILVLALTYPVLVYLARKRAKHGG
jgi:ABC-type amino acid transport system permease subunit